MKTTYVTAASLDGFLADGDHGLEWLLQFPHPDDAGFAAFLDGVGAVAMGASTYHWLLRNETFADPDAPKPWAYAQPTWVFSTREQPTVPDADLRFVQGDVRPVHDAMVDTAGGRDVWIVGGGELAGQFLDAGRLDEIVVTIAPVTLGSGAPLLPRRLADPPLRLTGVRPFGETFVELTYAVPSAARSGSPSA